jgi:exopolyphosphatase/guanosine-5'-triphosphate,3'-diphosphate pyrophosphatase
MDRADLILPGCAILSAIMENWPCATLRVADRGLREGMLIALLRESEAAPVLSVADTGMG